VDALMMRKEMLLDLSARSDVCPSLNISQLAQLVANFTPDECVPV
jgi:hypothetical protein